MTHPNSIPNDFEIDDTYCTCRLTRSVGIWSLFWGLGSPKFRTSCFKLRWRHITRSFIEFIPYSDPYWLLTPSKPSSKTRPDSYAARERQVQLILIQLCFLFACAGFRLNNAWANSTVLRPFLQPKAPFPHKRLVSGFKCKLRDSNS